MEFILFKSIFLFPKRKSLKDKIEDYDGNMLIEGNIYLQEKKYWEKFINKPVIANSNSTELYFVENNIETFIK